MLERAATYRPIAVMRYRDSGRTYRQTDVYRCLRCNVSGMYRQVTQARVERRKFCVWMLQISQDLRYTALPERRCRQLFNQYHSTLKDLQSAPATSASSSYPSPSSTATAPSSPSGDSSSSLTPEEAEKAASALWQLSEQLAASTRQQQPSSGGEQLRPGKGSAELAQPNGAQLPSAGDIGSQAQPSVVQLDALEGLRQEQARLKAEYDRMEV